MYSIDQNSLAPPLSMLLGLLLAFGLEAIGHKILTVFCKLHENYLIHPRALSIPVGAATISLIIYPMALVNLAYRNNMAFVAIVLIVIGFINLLILSKRLSKPLRLFLAAPKQWFNARTFTDRLVLFIVIEYFLLSLCAVSNADSLDYHMGVAISILNNGGLVYQPEWVHGRLAGSQEILNALGLSVGSEQFGSIMQFTAFMTICELVFSARARGQARLNRLDSLAANYFFLAILSAPVFIFLVTSSKPDLWGISLSTSAFAILFRAFNGEYAKKEYLQVCFAITFLALSVYIAKFKFILSASTLCLALLYWAYQKKKSVECLFILILGFVVLITPSLVFKSITYNASLLDSATSPLPGHIFGTAQWMKFASRAADMSSSFSFPFSILIPDKIGNLSGILGMGIFLFFSRKYSAYWKAPKELVVVCALYLLAILILAPPSSRNLVEPLLWIAILTIGSGGYFSVFGSRFFGGMIAIQAFISVAMASASVIMYLPSAFSVESRKSILEASANGYVLMEWVDSVAPSNAVILSMHRSIALIPRQSISYDWHPFLPDEAEAKAFFIKRLIARGVTHALLLDDPKNHTSIKDCFGSVVIGHDVNPFATRNPFNSSQKRDAWFVKINADKLPDCAK